MKSPVLVQLGDMRFGSNVSRFLRNAGHSIDDHCVQGLTREDDGGLLPHGVRRHLLADEEAQVGAQALHEGRARGDAVRVKVIITDGLSRPARLGLGLHTGQV